MTSERPSGDAREQERIEQLARLMISVVDSWRGQPPPRPGGLLSLLGTLRAQWPLVLGGISVVVTLLGWGLYGVSPLQAIKEIGQRQEQRQLLLRMVQRHLSLGDAFLNVDQLEAADSEFARALRLDPQNAEAQFGLRKAEVFRPLATTGYDPELVERRLRAILAERPADAHALTFLGDLYYSIDRDSAEHYYRRALAADPREAAAYGGLAVLFDLRGEPLRDSALAMYELAAAQSPWNQTFLNNLAYQYFLRRDYPKAIERYELLLKLDWRYALSYLTLGMSYMVRGQMREARDRFEHAVRLLNDTVAVRLPTNSGEWFFHTRTGSVIHLYSGAAKRSYGYYSLALVAMAEGRSRDVAAYLARARLPQAEDDRTVRALVRSDAALVAEERPKLRAALAELERMLY